jgi:hypothetical protein
MKMETGYAIRADSAKALRGGDAEPQESVVFRAVGNLQDEINGLSVQIDMLWSRIGAASRPVHLNEAKSSDRPPEPTTSLLTKKIDDQAKRIRMLSNQVAVALEGLEL